MRLKNLDLIVSILVAAVNVGWVLLGSHSPIVNIILALPLVFMLPGYTLTEALFNISVDDPDPLIRKPRLKIERPFNISDRLILSLGLSLTIDIITGFVLNILPSGLHSLSWAVFLGFATTIFSLIAGYRRRRMPINPGRIRVRSGQSIVTPYDCILLGLAVIVVFVSIWYSTITAQQQSSQGFTQFWLLPSEQLNDNCGLLIGMQSYETTPITYRIEVTINGSQATQWSSIVLSPNKQWNQLVLAKPGSASSLYIQALLYRLDKPNIVYREAHVTLNILEENQQRKVQC